jgi:hypothetical protein
MSVMRNEAPTVVGGRYSLICTLRAREGVRTSLSRDPGTGTSVVLTLAEKAQVSHSQWERVRHEAELLSSSPCRQLTPILDWGTDARWAFTVSPCIPGEPVREVVALSLPDLSSVLHGTGNGDQLPSRQGRNQTVLGLVGLLEALGAPSAPAVILLDDFQWADDLSIDSVAEWQRAHDADTHVLIAATCRSRDIDGRHPLPRVALHDRMRIGSLDPQGVRALAESSAGLLPDAALDIIVDFAGRCSF